MHRLKWLVPAGLALLLVALVARQQLFQQADSSRFDPTPTPRPVADAPYIPTPPEVVRLMVEEAGIRQEDVVYDLGCGDGRLVIEACKATGCRGLGIDIDPELIAQAQANAQAQEVDHLVEFREQSVYELDLRPASVVMVYLLPAMLEKLIPQFDQMKDGARIVSHDFRIAGCKPDRSSTVRIGIRDHDVHVWILPLKKGTDVR